MKRRVKRIKKSPTNEELWITNDESIKLRGPICYEGENMILQDLKTGMPVRSRYGTINEEGKFVKFCSSEECFVCEGKHSSGVCRENQEYQKREGVYIEI